MRPLRRARVVPPVPGRRAALASRRTRPRYDDGSGTVVVLGVVAVLLVLGAGAGLLLGVVRARQAAVVAADLAALAAAQVVLDSAGGVGDLPGRSLGAEGDCPQPAGAAAEDVARANRAVLADCEVLADGSVVVTTQVPLTGPATRLGPAAASARAGSQPSLLSPGPYGS